MWLDEDDDMRSWYNYEMFIAVYQALFCVNDCVAYANQAEEGDIIDIDAEKARLTKAIEKLEKELGQIKGKLSNEKFVANAPEHVVDESRTRLESGAEELSTLQEAMARVAALG